MGLREDSIGLRQDSLGLRQDLINLRQDAISLRQGAISLWQDASSPGRLPWDARPLARAIRIICKTQWRGGDDLLR